ncbi:hypothetical protein [Methylocucumis oryzae]|uniref:Uncharacterized protein n=1 Tax=Methylocucumis oryzae TaxID=1632867 RepID=A0A0F3IR73_9GAMM|nr:hypothetical protein [Methylocucumis oryzae]KJV08089.1 hypothetical protein VZ94_00585 [Methylocucumis oryzae]
MLEHDSEGFLIADRTAINEEGVNYLEQISDQLAEIKDLVSGIVSTASANPVANSQEQNTPEPATNDTSISVQPQIQANAELNPTIDVSVNIELPNPVGNNTVNRNFNRDALGRFISGNTNLAEIINTDNAQTINNGDESQRVINRQRDAQGRFIRSDNTAEAMAEAANNSTNNQLSQNTDNHITNTVLPSEIANSAQQTINNRTDNRLDSRSSAESSNQNSNTQINNGQPASDGRQRDSRGRFIRSDNTAEAGNESGNRGRDNRGRFTAGSRSPSERQEERGLIGKLIDAVSGRSSDGVDLQDVGPMIRAANEINELASPIFNTIGAAWNVAGKIGGLIPRRRASENTSEPVAPTANQPQRRAEPTNASEQAQANAGGNGDSDSASNTLNRRRRTSRTSERASNTRDNSRTSANERTSTSETIAENRVDQQRSSAESTTSDRQSADVSINNSENSPQVNSQRGNEEINRTTDSRPPPQITRDVIIAEQNVAEPLIENTGISAREETRQSKAFKTFFLPILDFFAAKMEYFKKQPISC